MKNERFDDVVHDYIDFINQQVGAYMDALAGFEGHHTRVERQIARINAPVGTRLNNKGEEIIVRVGYDDPSRPDVIHNRIIRASDYVKDNSRGGANEQQHSKAILIFVYAYWEHDVRKRLAKSKGVKSDRIQSDIMGDLRILRNAILHRKSFLDDAAHGRLKKLGDSFPNEGLIQFEYDSMQKIFVLIKQDLGKMLLEFLGAPEPPGGMDNIVDIAYPRNVK